MRMCKLLVPFFLIIGSAGWVGADATTPNVAVGPQYDSMHIYVASGDLGAFVKSFVAMFGGGASKVTVTNVLPVPSSTDLQSLLTPVGTLSVFAFQTPLPYPFVAERTG